MPWFTTMIRVIGARAILVALSAGSIYMAVAHPERSPARTLCARLYHEARTAADSARVAERYPFLLSTGRAQTCGGTRGRGSFHR
jgi:hypothetical protein